MRSTRSLLLVVLALCVVQVCPVAFAADQVADAPGGAEANRLKNLSLDHSIAQHNRIQKIAQRLQITGAELCRNTRTPIMGAAIMNVKDMHESLKPTAQARFGKRTKFYVVGVFEGMAGERAGLKVGDGLVTLNGTEVKTTAQFYGFKRRGGKPNRLKVFRDGKVVELTIEIEYGCRYPAELTSDDEVNAYANGKTVQFTLSLLRYFDSDGSLAIIVGHELGHNIYWSPGAARRGGWTQRKREAQADYVGLYLAAMAGYSIDGGFQSQFGDLHGVDGYSKKSAHPRSPERSIAERKTIEEIQGKMERGERLELRKK